MSEQIKTITNKTFIPIGVLIIVIGAAMWVGSLATQVNALMVKDSPSRAEYSAMCQQISDIKAGVDNINDYLIKGNQLTQVKIK